MAIEEIQTPSGIRLRVGQIWHERDVRCLNAPRQVKILGWKEVDGKIKVNIEGFVKTWAKLSRFTGKNGGYEFYKG